jgi:hypothetical protein
MSLAILTYMFATKPYLRVILLPQVLENLTALPAAGILKNEIVGFSMTYLQQPATDRAIS